MFARRESAAPQHGAFTRIVLLARPYWPHLAVSLGLSLVAVPLSLLTPVPLKIAVDNVIGGQPLPAWLQGLTGSETWSPDAVLVGAALLVICTVLLSHLQSLASWMLGTYTGQKLVLEFRSRLFEHVQRLSLSYHDARGSADSTYRIQYDAPSIEHITVNGIVPLTTSALMLIGMLCVTATMDLQLAIVALGVMPVLYTVTALYGGRLRTRWKEVRRLDSSAMSVVQEVLSAMRVVKAFGSEDRERRRFMRSAGDTMRKQMSVAVLQGKYDLLVGVVLACGTAASLYVGVRHVVAGSLTLGQLLMVMSYVALLYEPLRTVSKKVADLQAGLAGAERAFALLDETPEVRESADAKPLARASGALELRAVSFAYPGQHELLRGVSLRVPSGARVGIRGATGAGKTTLMNLLTRFYDPTGGRILLDGTDLRDFRLKDLRAQFAIVLQEPVLFSTTIGENIAYGRPGATKEDIERAAKLANAHDFISALPAGYESLVGERGMALSGGERQRISLARAFLRDAPLLILDEPTSSVDVKTETQIMDAMQRLMRGRTVFMIAHRLTTLEQCDIQLLVQNGTAVLLTESLVKDIA
jgi:ATP-binding cassette, subfamily B, bacterial